jgi:hypothetical protein
MTRREFLEAALAFLAAPLAFLLPKSAKKVAKPIAKHTRRGTRLQYRVGNGLIQIGCPTNQRLTIQGVWLNGERIG